MQEPHSINSREHGQQHHDIEMAKSSSSFSGCLHLINFLYCQLESKDCNENPIDKVIRMEVAS